MRSLAVWWTRESSSGFLLRFVVIAGLAFGAYAFPFELFGFEQDWLAWYLNAYARVAGTLLGLLDSSVVVTADVIDGRFSLQIVRTCDAAEVCILFASAVLAFPGARGRKLLALIAGLLCLVASNLLRICCLYFIGVYRPGWFKVSHEEVWPLLLVGFATFVFLRSARFLQAVEVNHGAVANG